MSKYTFSKIGIPSQPLMAADDVVALIRGLEKQDITIWIDGGWAVDALLGEQTRDHGDVDIVIQQKDVPGLQAYLQARNFGPVERDDTSSHNYVMGDPHGRQIDVHVVVFDNEGNGIYGPPQNNVFYPAGSLDGRGNIGGCTVRCITPAQLVKFHTGYALREKDFHDVSALCKRFGLDYPDEYRRKWPQPL